MKPLLRIKLVLIVVAIALPLAAVTEAQADQTDSSVAGIPAAVSSAVEQGASQPSAGQGAQAPPAGQGAAALSAGQGAAPSQVDAAAANPASSVTSSAQSDASENTSNQTITNAAAPASAGDDPTEHAPQPVNSPAAPPAGTRASAPSTSTSPPGSTSPAAQSSSTATDHSGAPAQSNSTSQFIWQIQIAGCTANCQGTSQTQVAVQQNTTVQTVPGGGAPAVGSSSSSVGSSKITELQVGCLQECTGTTTTGVTGAANALAQGIAQRLLAAVTATDTAIPRAALESNQNIVNQTTQQWQLVAGAATQSETASQANTTVQIVSSSLSGALEAAVASPDPSPPGVVNRTQQGIWQVQIGCLIFCASTQQSQQAAQSDTTTQVLLTTPGAAASATISAVNIATQLIWQLQIGCLLSCFDATQQQTATQHQMTLVTVLTPPTSPDPTRVPPATEPGSSSSALQPPTPVPPGGSPPSVGGGAAAATPPPPSSPPRSAPIPAPPPPRYRDQPATTRLEPIPASGPRTQNLVVGKGVLFTATGSGPAWGGASPGSFVSPRRPASPGADVLSTELVASHPDGKPPPPAGGADRRRHAKLTLPARLSSFGAFPGTGQRTARGGGTLPLLLALSLAAAVVLATVIGVGISKPFRTHLD